MFTVIYKPTIKCNLACSYCYVGLRDTESLTQDSIIDEIDIFKLLLMNLKRINDPNICVIFHGGEPLLMGYLFYEECANLIKEYESEYGIYIKKCIQTNFTNVTTDFLKSLQLHGYEISTSLDGTKLAHDYFRITANGTETFDKVVKNIMLAKSMGFIINAICCVSQLNVNEAKEAYKTFNELEVNPKFNYLESETSGMPQEAMISPEQYADFVIKITNLWINDKDSKIDILPSSDMLSAVVNGYSESCIHADNCQRNFVCVGPDGDVWPCGKCIGITPFSLGNITNHENGVVSFKMRSKVYGQGVGSPIECTKCEHSTLCNGLCPFDSYAEHGHFDRVSKWCKGYKKIWGYMKEVADNYNLNSLGN